MSAPTSARADSSTRMTAVRRSRRASRAVSSSASDVRSARVLLHQFPIFEKNFRVRLVFASSRTSASARCASVSLQSGSAIDSVGLNGHRAALSPRVPGPPRLPVRFVFLRAAPGKCAHNLRKETSIRRSVRLTLGVIAQYSPVRSIRSSVSARRLRGDHPVDGPECFRLDLQTPKTKRPGLAG